MMWVEQSVPRKRSRWPAGLRWEEAGMEAGCSAVGRAVPWAVKWVERTDSRCAARTEGGCHTDGREVGRPGGYETGPYASLPGL